LSSENNIEISQASEKDFDFIVKHVKKFDLDDRQMDYSQFTIAKRNNKIIGFGRIRKHNGCDEFCSLGVIEEDRHYGVAKALIEARIKIATQPIYLVCIIPEMFEPLGFKIVTEYPLEIQNKLDYCTSELVVPEPYVVMKKM